LRAEARQVRETAHRLAGPGAALMIADNFLRSVPWPTARCIAGYLPIRDEADVTALLCQLGDQGKDLLLPAVMGPDLPLEFRRWCPDDPLEPGPFHTWQPCNVAERAIPDMLLVPMLAYDERGRRLGYGGGYYDRTLADLRHQGTVTAIGIAYAAQKMKSLPCEAHDQPLDWVVTEQTAWEIKA
jgi:5-formyltetrahydrofolate cyclo-ligase